VNIAVPERLDGFYPPSWTRVNSEVFSWYNVLATDRKGGLVMLRSARGLDWTNSKAHLLLLSKFVVGQEVDYFAKWGNWEEVLNESPQKAIKRFVDEGLLTNADLDTVVSYKYKLADLKSLLRQRGLAVSGVKEDLVQRLIQADRMGMMQSVSGIELLVCSQAGREIAERYIALEKDKRAEVERQTIGYLEKRMFREACLVVASYEAGQVFSRGMGVDWKRYNPNRDIEMLRDIYGNKPEILSNLDNTKLYSLQTAAGMMLLWGESKATRWLPVDFETGLSMDNESAARMILFNAQSTATLKQYGDSGVAKYVEVLATPNSCESCKKLEGKRYRVDLAPKLPNPHCTHKLGCRCVYLPCVS
jgi:hypothetical protein